MQRSCPNCGSSRVRRSRTVGNKDEARRVLQARYRCRSCRSLFWAVSTPGLRLAIGAGVFAALGALAIGALVVVAVLDEPFEDAATESAQAQVSADTARLGGLGAERDLTKRHDLGEDHAPSDNDRMASLERAAQRGDVDAQYALGARLLSGDRGVDDARAAAWLSRAAERGNGLAQLELGRLYRSGVGVKADYVKAYVWLSLAAAQKVSGADIARDAVATLLTPPEIREAQAESLRISKTQHAPPAPTR